MINDYSELKLLNIDLSKVKKDIRTTEGYKQWYYNRYGKLPFQCVSVSISNKTEKDREWICVNCNTKYDRDINTAVNIKNFALKNYVSGTDTKTRNELPTVVGVLTSEA